MFLEYESVKDNLIKYKCLSCNKGYSNKIEKLKKWFKNIFQLSNNGIRIIRKFEKRKVHSPFIDSIWYTNRRYAIDK